MLNWYFTQVLQRFVQVRMSNYLIKHVNELTVGNHNQSFF